MIRRAASIGADSAAERLRPAECNLARIDRNSAQQVRIEAEIETVFDEKPVWEARPVTASSEPIAPAIMLFRLVTRCSKSANEPAQG